MSVADRVLLIAALGLGLGLAAGPSSVQAGPRQTQRVDRVVEDELELTQKMQALESARVGLERSGEALDYATRIMRHGAFEGLRKIDSYAAGRAEAQRRASAKARRLYKLSRGQLLRVSLQGDPTEFGAAESLRDAERGRDQANRARELRRLVQGELRELGVHRRAELGAKSSLVASTRELAAAAALRSFQGMERDLIEAASSSLAPRLGHASRKRERLEATGYEASRGLRRELERARNKLRRSRGLSLLEPRALHRPVQGAVVGRFGPYTDRVLRVSMQRQGVELRARRRERVGAIAPGVVAFVGRLPGYEEVVVLDHGGGYISLTGRLVGVRVREGQELRQGEMLGRPAPKTARDGLGRTVYLEVRHAERPVDPTSYLARPQD